ncbi:TetR/AcrR family transcriptional regulator [Methylocella silvestris]|nr:TetR/AcrR family transcriptional regulator [Methylocella silvestris]
MSSNSTQTSLRLGNRQRQRTRKSLLSAGQKLFAEQPADSVTITDITEEAEVAKGSFYNHFVDKEAFAEAIYTAVHGELNLEIDAANSGEKDPAARIARALCLVLRHAQRHPEKLSALLSLAGRRSADAPLNDGVTADVAEGLRVGRFNGLDTKTGVLIVLSLIMETVRCILSGGFHEKTPAPALAGSVATAMLRALGTPGADAELVSRSAVEAILWSASGGSGPINSIHRT